MELRQINQKRAAQKLLFTESLEAIVMKSFEIYLLRNRIVLGLHVMSSSVEQISSKI